MDHSTLKDEQLLERLANGESWAMAVLYDRYARLVFSLALKILNDRPGAEDAVQEVFVKVWRRAGDYDPAKGKFSSWLGSIAHHHAIDELRRRRARPSTEQDESAAEEIPAEGLVPFEAAVQSIDQQRIFHALECIPADQRRPIELAYFEGYTQQEIAKKLGEPLGTIKTRIRLGMIKLRDLLQEDE